MTTVWLVRHGETEWSRDGRHTSDTDLPLTEKGADVARSLAPRLEKESFALVLSSPLQRATTTAELAGFPDPEHEDDLREWSYGDYEGITTEEIRESVPGWSLWAHPTPGGESAAEVTERLDRVVARLESVEGDVLVFAHGHSLRALTARWLGLEVSEGRLFHLDTATVSVLGHERDNRAVVCWNS